MFCRVKIYVWTTQHSYVIIPILKSGTFFSYHAYFFGILKYMFPFILFEFCQIPCLSKRTFENLWYIDEVVIHDGIHVDLRLINRNKPSYFSNFFCRLTVIIFLIFDANHNLNFNLLESVSSFWIIRLPPLWYIFNIVKRWMKHNVQRSLASWTFLIFIVVELYASGAGYPTGVLWNIQQLVVRALLKIELFFINYCIINWEESLGIVYFHCHFKYWLASFFFLKKFLYFQIFPYFF